MNLGSEPQSLHYCQGCIFRGTGERNREYALLMTANNPETVLYRTPTLLELHGGLVYRSMWLCCTSELNQQHRPCAIYILPSLDLRHWGYLTSISHYTASCTLTSTASCTLTSGYSSSLHHLEGEECRESVPQC